VRILFFFVLVVICIHDVDLLYRHGFETLATLFCFVLLLCLILLADATNAAIDNMPGWIIRRAMRTPYVHLAGYMERYWFIRIGRRGGGQSGTYPLVGARVHHILRSDDDRHFHDHPWPYLTVILRGGYWEVRPVFIDQVVSYERRRWHGPGSVLLRRAGSWHRLELPEGQTAWTLFCTGPKVQHWGFLVGRRKVHWREYLGVPDGVGED